MIEPPRAVFIIGPAGSGKSTVARKLASILGATYLDKDTLAGPFVRHAMRTAGREPDAREHDEYYRAELMPLEYQTLFAVARDNLALGRTVILDAPFAAYLEDSDYLTTMCRDAGWPAQTHVIVATVVVDPADLVARLTARGSDRDRWKLANWSDFWTRFGETRCAWVGVTSVTIDNGDAGPDLQELIHAFRTDQPHNQPLPPSSTTGKADRRGLRDQ